MHWRHFFPFFNRCFWHIGVYNDLTCFWTDWHRLQLLYRKVRDGSSSQSPVINYILKYGRFSNGKAPNLVNMYLLLEWQGRIGKYLTQGPYVLTKLNIFPSGLTSLSQQAFYQTRMTIFAHHLWKVLTFFLCSVINFNWQRFCGAVRMCRSDRIDKNAYSPAKSLPVKINDRAKKESQHFSQMMCLIKCLLTERGEAGRENI